jgi:hypothetical protein
MKHSLTRPLVLTEESVRHPFRRQLGKAYHDQAVRESGELQRQLAKRRSSQAEDASLFLLSFSAFFVAFSAFLF